MEEKFILKILKNRNFGDGIVYRDKFIEKLCKVTKLESEFKRTESRINEMQQEKYIQMEHRT